MEQFDKWFDERDRAYIRNLFISWLKSNNVRGIYDATFKPEVLEEEWLSFLFYIGRKISKMAKISNADIYYEIRHASNEDLLEAAIHYWKEDVEDEYAAYCLEKWMRLGFALAQEDGWKRTAPAWLEDWHKHIEIPF